MKTLLTRSLVMAAIWIAANFTTIAQDFRIDWFTVNAAAGASGGGEFALIGSIGQAESGRQPLVAGEFSLTGGLLAPLTPSQEPPGPVIFDNTGGVANSFEYASTNNWLANKFCTGSQAYRLDQITLSLSTRDPARKPFARLRLYSADLASGRPAAELAVVMNLSGATNPISFQLSNSSYETPISWVPLAPFVLSPNTCYWAVLSTDDGEILYPVAAVLPSGPAAVLGRAASSNGGRSWGPPDETTNRRMKILGTPAPAPQLPVAIFDNSAGTENGGFGATATTWLAGKFCLGSQPYDLESVSLLLSNGSSTGQPSGPSSVKLRIFAHNPATGKPAADTGASMQLAGLANPFPVGSSQWVKWTTSQPVKLAPNICYWAVFSVDGGVSAGLIASFTKPAGDAGTFGASTSSNSGTTWSAPDAPTNFKMVVMASRTQIPAPIELAVDASSPIPGGTGNFTDLRFAPVLSQRNLLFHGAGSSGQEGFYRAESGAALSKIVDRSTPIPNGGGTFEKLGDEAGIIIVSGNIGIFPATGPGGQRGIYGAVLEPPQVFKVADLATAIPGGGGTFTAFSQPRLSGSTAVFVGAGAAQKGIYASAVTPPQSGVPFKVADFSTAVPQGAGAFTDFPDGLDISDNTAVFHALGSSGQKGVYASAIVPSQPRSPFRIADASMPVPDGTGNFESFGSERGIIIVSGRDVVFTASGPGGRKGIYGAKLLSEAFRGASADLPSEPTSAGAPFRIVDTTTPVPGGEGTFADFAAVNIDQEAVTFLGLGASGQAGIFSVIDGHLQKVIATGDLFKDKAVAGLGLSVGGLAHGQVAFQATFADASSGLYTLELPPQRLRLRVTSSNNGGLRLAFRSREDDTYLLQTRSDLASGAWADLSGDLLSGNGAEIEIDLPRAASEALRFYRLSVRP